MSIFLFVSVGLTLLGVIAAWAVFGLWPPSRMVALRHVALVVAALLTAAPLSILLTLALVPFWSWLEATGGIESVGHSGPAEWCFLVVFLTCFGILTCVGMLMMRRGARDGES